MPILPKQVKPTGQEREGRGQLEAILRKQDNGEEVRIKGREVFEIQLQAMGEAGYWGYLQPPDARHMELLGENTGAQTEGRPGGPVLAIWTFWAKEPGKTEVKMHYYRSWEGVERAGATEF